MKQTPSFVRIAVSMVIVAVWIGAMVLLMEKEGLVPSSRETGPFSGVIPDDIEIDSWRSVYAGDRWIGYIYTRYGPSGEGFVSRSHSHLRFRMFNQAHELTMESLQRLDRDHRLTAFETTISGIADIHVTGERVADELITIFSYGDRVFRKAIPLDENLFLDQSLFQVYRGAGLAQGDTYRLRILNPLTLQDEEATIRVVGTEGTLLVMESQVAGLTSRSWIDENGMVVREEAPNGWTVIAESRHAVERYLRAPLSAAVDIVEEASVPVAKRLARPRSIRSLTLRLEGIDVQELPTGESRQTILDRNQGIVRIAAGDAADITGIKLPLALADEDRYRSFLEPSLWIDSDDPAIVATARAIVGEEKNAWAAARLIGAWVYDALEKTPSPDIPVASAVLKHRRGDCNEHTSLFVALARATGIPATLSAGLVFLEGAFYYHVWPRVYVGEWISMDPTFGQAVADATHLELVSGNFEAQAQIAMTMGRISIDIIEYDHRE